MMSSLLGRDGLVGALIVQLVDHGATVLLLHGARVRAAHEALIDSGKNRAMHSGDAARHIGIFSVQ